MAGIVKSGGEEKKGKEEIAAVLKKFKGGKYGK